MLLLFISIYLKRNFFFKANDNIKYVVETSLDEIFPNSLGIAVHGKLFNSVFVFFVLVGQTSVAGRLARETLHLLRRSNDGA